MQVAEASFVTGGQGQGLGQQKDVDEAPQKRGWVSGTQ